MMELREKFEEYMENMCDELPREYIASPNFKDWLDMWEEENWKTWKITMSINTPKHETVDECVVLSNDDSDYTCLTCGKTNVKASDAYCSDCGRKIKEFREEV